MASPLIEAAKFGKSLVRGAGEAASSAKPFYSNIDQAIAAITQSKGTGEQMLAQILKTKGVAKELKDRPAIKAALQQPKITKEELQKVAADNPPPQIFEKIDKGPSESKYTVEYDKLNDRYEVLDDSGDAVKSFYDPEDAEDYVKKLSQGTAKFDDFQIPGGQNYREIKIMLPNKRAASNARYNEIAANARAESRQMTNEEMAERLNLESKIKGDGEFKSKHFSEPNILAHARVSDRTAPTYTINDIADIQRRLQEGLKIHDPKALGSGASIWGVKNGVITPLEAAQISHARGWRNDTAGAVNKILHIEEIQSDWHQAARDIRKKEIGRLVKSGMSKEDAARQVPVDYGYKDIGDAPFKDNWHELVLKRMLDDAVKNGYNKVVISPGAVQVGRYEDEFRSVVDNLSISHRPKDVLGERISVSAEKDGVDTFNYDYEKTKDGWMSTEPIKGQRRTLEETVGKDILKKFESDANYNKTIGSDNSPIRLHNFSGDDITIGGEGMKGFYDDIIPSYLNNYGKQYEAKVGTYRMDDPNKDYNWSDYTPTMADMNRIGMERFGADRVNMTPEQLAEAKEIHRQNVADQRAINLHSFDITPQMRQSITEKGQPLNQIIPAGVGAEALVGQQEEAPEQPTMKRGGVVGMAGGGKAGALKSIGEIFIGKSRVKVRPPSDNVANVRDANFQYPRTIGNQNVNIGDLTGGVRFDKQESQRVNQLADKIISPDGYISRIIVDHDNNVVEGQHRLEALRKLGATEVPVYKIEDLAETMPTAQMESAIRSVGAIHSDHSHQLMQHVLNDIAEHGIEGAREMDAGAFQKFYDAALDAATPKIAAPDLLVKEKAKGGVVGMDAMRMALMNKKVQHKQVGGISRGIRKMAGAPNKTTNIIKEGGGNWFAGGVEKELKGLKRDDTPVLPITEAEITAMRNAGYTVHDPVTGLYSKPNPTNQFIDKQITKYIKNQMGTKEDPIRLAADAFPVQKAKLLAAKQVQIDKATADMEKAQQSRGFTPDMMTRSQARIRALEKEKELIERREGLHFKPYETFHKESKLIQKRVSAGMPAKELGQTENAKNYEVTVDKSIDPSLASDWNYGSILHPEPLASNPWLSPEPLASNPWLSKVAPDSKVYATTSYINDLGFDHMMDELRNATNAASGLPKDLLIDSKDLSKWTMAQAAEHVDKINAYRASQKAEADVVRANNAATVLHKDYPEKGMRWVELKTPEATLPEGYKILPDVSNYKNPGNEMFTMFDDQGKAVSTGATEAEAMRLYNRQGREGTLSDALKYEGEQMQHCVGGYCPDVISGESRIYSLRDAKGNPHATIEVKPGSEKSVSDIPSNIIDDYVNQGRPGNFQDWVKSNYPDLMEKNPPSINQIKGKGNAAPSEEYLPYVQDFVRSSNYSDVRDLQNTGLTRHKDKYFTEPELEEYTNSIINPTKDWYHNSPYFKTYRQLNDNLDSRGNLYQDLNNWSGRMHIPVGTSRYSISDIHGVLSEPRAYDLSTLEQVRDAVDWLKVNQPEIPRHLLPEVPPTEGMKDGGVVNMAPGGFLKQLFNVLPAVEREANLKKFRELSKAPMRLYHGTTATEGGKGEEAIRILKPSKEGALGSGAYLTPNPKFAGEYSFPKDISDAARASIQSGIDNKELFRRGSGNILPVYAQLKNPLILEGIKSPGAMYSGDPMVEALKKLGMDEGKASNMVEKAYENRGYIGRQVQSRAQAQGYDGIMQYRDGELMEVLPFSSNQVKSAIGNEGTYDIYRPELNKAKGGSVNMDAMRLALMNKQIRK